MKLKLPKLSEKVINRTLVIILVLIIIYLIFNYFFLDTLNVYDAAGQTLAVDHAKSFWPNWQGWSTRELLGWPQGLIYPPGIHWIMSGLALIIGSDIAIKIIVSIALISLPFTIWWYQKQIKIPKKWRYILIILFLSISIIIPDYMGSNISSLFQLGFITNFVTLPILFLYLGIIEKITTQTTLKNIILASLLLGILVWSHLVIAMIGLIYLGLISLVILFQRKWKIFGCLISIGLSGLIICSPFLIEMIPLIKNQITSSGEISPSFWLNLITALISLILIIYFWRKSIKSTLMPAIMGFFLSSICLLDIILTRLFETNFLGWLHAYRFQTFAFIFASIAIFQLIINLSKDKKFDLFKIINMLSILLLIFVMTFKNPNSFDYASIEINENNINGRFLEDFRRTDSYPAPYTFQTKLLKSNPNSSWAYGLFIESSPNSSFIKSLSKSLHPELYINDPVTNNIEDIIIPPKRIPVVLNLFAIDNIISLNNDSINSIGTWSYKQSKKYYHLTKLQTKNLAESPSLNLTPITNNWNETIINWWKDQNDLINLPYDASQQRITSPQQKDVIVDVNVWKDNEIVLNINSKNPVPVIIKTTYSNKWKAVSQDGSNLIIWRTAPQLMLIESSGIVHLRYK